MGGVVKGAFNVVKSVVKYGVNMVKSVIKNPLPTILTIGLNFVAPGISSFTGLSEWAVKGIGRAAISAANASANTARSRKPHKYSLRLFDSIQNSFGSYSITTVAISGCCVTGQIDDNSSVVNVTEETCAGAGNTSTCAMAW